ncbi:MAG: Gfo/Idh/MocA family oxidoreductase, partial [Acidimicrobiaceae bacterium]|nr:Gfo/Idh/MocA family oxidoreductase [Acidimicrobiaceae bacterium]
MGFCHLGIVGLGTAGAVMLEAANRHSGIQVVGVADPRVDVLPVPGGIRRYHSLDELLRESGVGVDAVYIATPTSFHNSQIFASLSAGCHVMVEKPVTATSGDASRLIAKAREQGRHVVVGHSESFEPYV